MIILGIDPGSRKTGFGVIEAKGQDYRYIAHGVVNADGKDFPKRIRVIYQGVRDVAREYSPDALAIEDVFVSKNPSSALKLGQARGAAICAVLEQDIVVSEYSPRLVKQTLVGRGAADKKQMQHMITMLLGLSKQPPEDAADALAIAVCHAHHQLYNQRIKSGISQ
ncbi:MAG: crossover junction endodeoxyribonuclease RuvC [bacterium]